MLYEMLNLSSTLVSRFHVNVFRSPVPKVCEIWGSRPIPGRNWISSQCCTRDLLAPCYDLIENCPDAGKRIFISSQ